LAHETVDAFRSLEAKDQHLKTKRARSDEDREAGPHVVMLAKGAVPEYIQLSSFDAFCWRMFGNYVKRKGGRDEELEEYLVKAHMKIRPEEYKAKVLTVTTILAVVGIVLAIVVPLVMTLLGGFMMYAAVSKATTPEQLEAAYQLGSTMTLIGALIGIALAVLMPVAGYFILKGGPKSKSKARARSIDKRLSSAMSFISAMASANVPVDVIFKELARQPVYGEIKAEAEWITRDTELLGIDIINAIKRGAARSPSTKFQDFLQGVVTTTTSGGQLKPYFMTKVEQFEKEDKLLMKQTMETLSMLAESYVTVVVAFPLFLVVILAIMAIIGGTAASTVMILWMVIGLMIPVSMVGFIFVIWSISQE
jgi:flagellar protein FlaJ